MTTRSGRGAESDPPAREDEPVDEEIVLEAPSDDVQQRQVPASTAQPERTTVEPPLRVFKPPLPYPGRLRQERQDAQNIKFLDMLKQLSINIPFVEALTQMPKYAKFLKDMLSNKTKLEEISTVQLNRECFVALERSLPEKVKDPGSFTIPCMMGDMFVSNALADLGASINLMPYSVFRTLGLGEP